MAIKISELSPNLQNSLLFSLLAGNLDWRRVRIRLAHQPSQNRYKNSCTAACPAPFILCFNDRSCGWPGGPFGSVACRGGTLMFDLRRFWLGTVVYGLMIGAVIAAAFVAFRAFIGLPTQGPSPQVVTQQPAPIQATAGKGVPVEIERKSAAPAVPPPSPPPSPPAVQRKPAPNVAAAMPQIFVPEPLIVPEPRSSRRGGSR